MSPKKVFHRFRKPPPAIRALTSQGYKNRNRPKLVELAKLNEPQEIGNVVAITGKGRRGNKSVYITHFQNAASQDTTPLLQLTKDRDIQGTPSTVTAIASCSDGKTVISTVRKGRSRHFSINMTAEAVKSFLTDAGLRSTPEAVETPQASRELAAKDAPPPPAQPLPSMYEQNP